MYVKCTPLLGMLHSLYTFTGNVAFLLVSNHFEIYPHDQIKVWHFFASIHIRYCH